MFPSKKASSMNSQERGMCVQPDSGLVLTTDPKPRLRWTVELHERFVDAVTQLGGPDKATPKTIMRVMGVNGLTLYHLKSHLQKFRLGKQPHKDFNDHSIKDGMRASALELQRNSASSSAMIGRNMNEMQMEVQRRLHEQLEVQKHLQLRIEAQGKYMQSILEKAYQTLAGENLKNINGAPPPQHHQANIIPPQDHFTSIPLNTNFPPFQDQLNIYGGGGDQLDHLHQLMPNSSNATENVCGVMNNNKRPLIWNSEDLRLHQDLGTASSCLDTDPFRAVSLDRATTSSEITLILILLFRRFLTPSLCFIKAHSLQQQRTENLCVGMMNNNKRPLIWNSEDLRLHQDLGTASSCLDTDPFRAVSLDRATTSSENNINIDPAISEIFDTKPLLHQVEDTLGDTTTDHNKKLEGPSSKRAHSLQQVDQRMSPMISTGTPF
ncbi:myb family transcription factor APL [Neltuma alba]|uniref:myb family transcription factor APL n=1 Tax=Neltuma alba TaxID=207710 RepID=UPI0010A37DB4|nr:myb family transcription factor APL-like [Prosopis alba]